MDGGAYTVRRRPKYQRQRQQQLQQDSSVGWPEDCGVRIDSDDGGGAWRTRDGDASGFPRHDGARPTDSNGTASDNRRWSVPFASDGDGAGGRSRVLQSSAKSGGGGSRRASRMGQWHHSIRLSIER